MADYEAPEQSVLEDEFNSACQIFPEATFFADENFAGFTMEYFSTMPKLDSFNPRTRMSSAVIKTGSWELFTEENFKGRKYVLDVGFYPSLKAAGLPDNAIKSVRPL